MVQYGLRYFIPDTSNTLYEIGRILAIVKRFINFDDSAVLLVFIIAALFIIANIFYNMHDIRKDHTA